jgi:hypothetical protein
MGLKSHAWITSGVQHERSTLRCGVAVIVVLELRNRKETVPVVLPLINKETEELFQFLVNPFRLAICLWMVSCGGAHFDVQ